MSSLDENGKLPREAFPLLLLPGPEVAQAERMGVVAKALRARGYPLTLAGSQRSLEALGELALPRRVLPYPGGAEIPAGPLWAERALRDMEQTTVMVEAERALIRELDPRLIIAEGRPTAFLSALFQGVDLWEITPAEGLVSPYSVMGRQASLPEVVAQYAQRTESSYRGMGRQYLIAELPVFDPTRLAPGMPCEFVGPLLNGAPQCQAETQSGSREDEEPVVLLDLSQARGTAKDEERLLKRLGELPGFFLVAGLGTAEALPDNVQPRTLVLKPGLPDNIGLYVGLLTPSLVRWLLREGVPFIGCAEFPEEEFVIDQYAALRLGQKIERANFTLEALADLIPGFLTCQAALKTACESFAPAMSGWWSGERLAELVDAHLRRTGQPSPFDGNDFKTETELVQILESMQAPGEQLAASDKLREFVSQGLPYVPLEKSSLYEWSTTLNWLFDRDEDFFTNHRRTKIAALETLFYIGGDGRMRSRHAQQRFRVSFDFSFDLSKGSNRQSLFFFLGYPIPTESQQDIALRSWYPEDLIACHLPSLGFFYGYEIRHPKGAGKVEFRYIFDITSKERCRQQRSVPPTLSPAERQQYLQVSPELRHAEQVVRFFDQYLPEACQLDDFQIARRIYEGIFRTRCWRSRGGPQDLVSSTLDVLDNDGGHCVSLSRAMIALCRIKGIPAREVRGVTLDYPFPGKPGLVSYGGSEPMPFRHMFSEVFLDGYGWIPIETESVAISSVAITEHNLKDPEVRAAVERWTEPSLDYFFGNLGFNNLVFSSTTLPLCMTCDQEPEGNKVLWQEVDLDFRCEQHSEWLEP